MPPISCDSQNPSGLATLSSADQSPENGSPIASKPAATRICIHIDVPERGVPVTISISASRPRRVVGWIAGHRKSPAHAEHRPRPAYPCCSSVEYARYTPSSRLGMQAADGVLHTRDFSDGLLAQIKL